jgi:fructose PTS system EIIA component
MLKLINKEMIVLDSELKNRDNIISSLAERALDLGYVSNLEEYINSVKKRESEFSTAIGYSVSIPHGKSEAVKEAFIAFLRSKEVFKWDENQEEEVRLVFLIGVPESKKETLHLKILAQISRKLMDEDFREKLLNENFENVYKLLSEIEKNIK